MNELALALRLARRELRGGLAGFRVFLACLAIGVAAIAAVGSVSQAITSGLERDARALLGGDVEVRIVHRPATPEQRAWLDSRATVSEAHELRAMARVADGSERTLVQLKAVDGRYPLFGAVEIEPAQSVEAALGQRDGRWGVVVDPVLMSRLGIAPGALLRIGEAEVEARGVLRREPDRGTQGLALGPRVLIGMDAFAATELVQPGSLIEYNYRLALPEEVEATAFAAEIGRAFPDAGWRVRDFSRGSPGLQRWVDQVTLFLTLVGLTALLVGGVGVGNAVRSYLDGKTETIATLKCLGAPSRLVVRIYLAQVMILALGGIAIGLVVGAAAPYLAAGLVAQVLTAEMATGIFPIPLLLAAAFGLLTALVFSLWPLSRAGEVAPAALFRALVAPLRRWPPAATLAMIAAAGLALAALAVLTAPDRGLALGFVAGAVATLLAFRGAAHLVILAARRARGARRPWLRLAVANLHRPGAPTGSVVLSLGLGLTVLVTIAMVEGNVSRQVTSALPDAAPAYFFIDIQPDQAARFDEIVNAVPGVQELERLPMLRGRITAVNGVPSDQVTPDPDYAWVLRGDRGLTYAAEPQPGTLLAEGAWWPADYAGPPLVSFGKEIADGLGVGIGDTLTVNILGRDVTGEIANLREIEWQTLAINFTFVFSPGLIESAPHTHLATVRTDPAAEEAVERAVTDAFPNVSAIRVKEALEAVADLIGQLAAAVRGTGSITLLAGTLVLAGAVAAGHRRRVYEAVVLKVLGATRRTVLSAFLAEYGLLGMLTAAIAVVVGSVASWAVLTQVMRTEWVFLPATALATAALSTLVVLGFGFVGTWRALGQKAAPLLRND